MLNRVFNHKTKTVTFAAVLLFLSSGVSALLGLIRDRLLAHYLGAGAEMDIYTTAFRIPDFVYGILIMGGISAVFLPIFSEEYKKNTNGAWEFANNLLHCFLILLVLICGILFIFAPFLINIIAPGFSPQAKETTAVLARIMFLSPILFGLSSIFSGVLHYFNRFLIYSIAPILYNIGIILGIIFFLPKFGLKGLAFGVILGAIFYFLLQIPAARFSGYKYKFILNFGDPGLKKVFKLMLPRTIGAAVYHFNLIAVTAIASTISTGSIAIVLYYSNNLQQLPISLIGVSFALAVFPTLSKIASDGSKEEFFKNFSSVFRQILFLIIPISVMIFLLRAQLVRLILGTGNFGWTETRLTAASLGIFALGIFALAFIPFLARVFYSFQDTKTPFLIGLISMVFNVGLSLSLVRFLSFPNFFHDFTINVLKLHGIENIAVIGLPLALSISGIFQFFLLLLFLKIKIKNLAFREIFLSAKRILLSSFLMALAVLLTLYLAANIVELKTFFAVFLQALLAGAAGIIVYILLSFFLKSPELKTFRISILGQFQK
ncbi:MAG: murein biosynthesis integral membrane protein MurJ [bacterium]|nr:murein biosynthesis integral membrane protein MurJ [bacterium]